MPDLEDLPYLLARRLGLPARRPWRAPLWLHVAALVVGYAFIVFLIRRVHG